jgi:hypothetical protein
MLAVVVVPVSIPPRFTVIQLSVITHRLLHPAKVDEQLESVTECGTPVSMPLAFAVSVLHSLLMALPGPVSWVLDQVAVFSVLAHLETLTVPMFPSLVSFALRQDT